MCDDNESSFNAKGQSLSRPSWKILVLTLFYLPFNIIHVLHSYTACALTFKVFKSDKKVKPKFQSNVLY